MTRISLPEIIADKIINRFRAGLDIDADTLHFLISCEGLPGRDDIHHFLNDRGNDSSPVYDLIFYPDSGMRYEIEQIIPACGLDDNEISGMVSIIKSQNTDIVLNLGSERIALPWDSFSMRAIEYINRLNLDVSTDIFPVSKMTEYTKERSLLRSADFSPSGEYSEFLGILADRAHKLNLQDCIVLFNFAILLLRDCKEKVMDLLENRRHMYESAIKDVVEFGRVTEKYTMEFIMAKKISVPLTGIDEAVDSIKKIDTITSLVYGIILPPMDEGVDMLLKNGKFTDFK